MARTTQQIIEDMLGKQTMQIAALTAALEDMTEKADSVQKALDEYVKAKKVPTISEVRDRMEREEVAG